MVPLLPVAPPEDGENAPTGEDEDVQLEGEPFSAYEAAGVVIFIVFLGLEGYRWHKRRDG